MKRYLILLFPLLLLGCKAENFLITGVLPQAANGDFVYLHSFSEGEILDSTQVEEGLFYFKGRVDEPFMGKVSDVKEDFLTLIIVEEGSISLDMGSDYVSGTQMNYALNMFKEEMKVFDVDFRSEMERIESDLELSSEEKEAALVGLEEGMKKLWKQIIQSYIEKYPDYKPMQEWLKNFTL